MIFRTDVTGENGMSKEKKMRIAGGMIALVALGIVLYTEQVIKPVYFIKSAVKVASFGGAVLLYALLSGQKLREIIRLHKPKKLGGLIACIALFFLGIGVLFLLFRSQLDLASIRESLVTKEGLTKRNCFFVFAYIILVNSFLEESFFRGFVSGLIPNRKVGFPVSAVLFSLYHIGIIGGWFHPAILALCIAGLAVVALFLQYLLERYHSVVASYLVHASANVAINTIGALMIFNIL